MHGVLLVGGFLPHGDSQLELSFLTILFTTTSVHSVHVEHRAAGVLTYSPCPTDTGGPAG